LIFAASHDNRPYFDTISQFIGATLGPEAQSRFTVISGDCAEVARAVRKGADEVMTYRRKSKDAFYFNWKLNIPMDLQIPFDPTHESMAKLNLSKDQPIHDLASNLRRAFSGIVAGNVKEQGINQIKEKGPFELNGDPAIMSALDSLLRTFVDQNRMKIGDETYTPCYRVAT